MSKHRREVPLFPCRCNCHDKEWRKMARKPEHQNCGECLDDLKREVARIYHDYQEYVRCVISPTRS